MRPLPFVWPYALVFWAIFIWAFAPEAGIVRRGRRSQTATDSRSLQIIMVGQGIANFGAFFVAWMPPMQASHRVAMLYAGTIIMVLASLLRRHCWRMLGASFTGDVRATADQRIVDRGAYRWLRHPSYTAGILLNGGMALALGKLAVVRARNFWIGGGLRVPNRRRRARALGGGWRAIPAVHDDAQAADPVHLLSIEVAYA